MPPRLVIQRVVGADLIIIVFATLLGLVTAGKPSRFFGEGCFTTVISCAQLLGVALLSSRIFLARRPLAARVGRVSAAWVWVFIAAGFAFLAVDDALEIHERLDQVIHKTFDIQETAWTDRLDDAIIAVYGLVGFAILWLFRTEILFFRGSRRPLGSGFSCLFASIICDAVSNDEQFLIWLFGHEATAKPLKQWIAIGDGGFTLLAEGFFLAAFYLSHQATSEPLHHAMCLNDERGTKETIQRPHLR